MEEMFSDTNCCREPALDCRKTYAMSGFEEDPSGRSMIVGLYGRDWDVVIVKMRESVQRTPVEHLMVCAVVVMYRKPGTLLFFEGVCLLMLTIRFTPKSTALSSRRTVQEETNAAKTRSIIIEVNDTNSQGLRPKLRPL